MTQPAAAAFDGAVQLATQLDAEIGRVIIGQHQVRREVVTCLLAGCLAPAAAAGLVVHAAAVLDHLLDVGADVVLVGS